MNLLHEPPDGKWSDLAMNQDRPRPGLPIELKIAGELLLVWGLPALTSSPFIREWPPGMQGF